MRWQPRQSTELDSPGLLHSVWPQSGRPDAAGVRYGPVRPFCRRDADHGRRKIARGHQPPFRRRDAPFCPLPVRPRPEWRGGAHLRRAGRRGGDTFGAAVAIGAECAGGAEVTAEQSGAVVDSEGGCLDSDTTEFD